MTPPLLDLVDWVSEHYLAPPGECHRLALPPAGVRASRAVVRLLKPDAPSDPVTDALREGPLRLTTLAARLKRDPASRIARLRRDGIVAVEQDLDAPGFRQVRFAELTEAAASFAAKGSAQADVLARLRAAGGRLLVADLTRERSSLRGALARLEEAGAVRVFEESADRGPRAQATRARAPDRAHRRPDGGARRAAAGARRAGLPAVPAARRHRQRQDRGLLPRHRARARAGPRRADPRARDRADAAAGARGRRALRLDRLRPAQRAVGGRAARPVVAHPRGRVPGRGGRAPRRVRAGAGRRPGRGRRGARRRPTSRTRARATTAATWRSCARSWRAPWSCSARRRRRSRRSRTRAPGSTSGSRCRSGSAARGCPRSRSWTAARS